MKFWGFLLKAGAATAVTFLIITGTGCRVVKTSAELPGKAVSAVTPGSKKAQIDPVVLQQNLLRFADDFSGRIVASTENLRRGTNRLSAIELQTWKVRYSGNVLAIASAQNTLVNLLDMVVLVTLTRHSIETYWMPQVYGESARPMLEVCQEAEARIWHLAGPPVLDPKQQEELRDTITAWYERNPDPNQVLNVRGVGFASELAQLNSGSQNQESSSVFNLLRIDPFSGLDPAAREIAQTRLFAERAMFVAQRMPTLLRWQMELLSYQITATPEIKQVLEDTERMTRSVESFAHVADQLPQLVNDQREAAIKQIFDGIALERTNLITTIAASNTNLQGSLAELRQTMEAATVLVRAVDKFLARYDKGTNAPVETEPTTNSRPFDIRDYAQTARDLTSTAKQLDELIVHLGQTLDSPALQKRMEDAHIVSKGVFNHVFLLAALLVVLFFICLLATRYLTARIGPTGQRSKVRGQRSEVGNQRSEVRDQKSEVGS
jgi:hypothetical protein